MPADVPGWSAPGDAEERVGEGEFVLMGEARRHRHLDAAPADADQRADFQQLEADRAAGGLRDWVWAADAAQRRAAHRPSMRTTGAAGLTASSWSRCGPRTGR